MKCLYIVLILVFCACSSDKNPGQLTDSAAADTATNAAQQIVNINTVPYVEPMDSSALSFIRKLETATTKIPLFAIIDGKYWLYADRGKTAVDRYFSSESRFGLIDTTGEILLPLEYNKIYNPDATAAKCFEIEQNGNRGLFNYETKKIVAPAYSVIFPSQSADYIAVGIREDRYFGIKKDFSTKEIFDFKGYQETSIATFDLKYFPLIYSNSSTEDDMSGDVEDLSAMGVLILPSYLVDLDFPEVFTSIITKAGAEFGTNAASGKIAESKSVSKKISALITHFYESIANSRGSEIEETKLVTIDSKNNIIENVKLKSGTAYFDEFCDQDFSYSFLSANLLEVKNRIAITKEVYDKYDDIPNNDYYAIDANGSIEKLESNRLFDATKFTLIDEDYVKGCYVKFRNDSEISDSKEQGDEQGNIWVSDHLDLEDLDMMRNEIFAEYGLIFKTEKWNSYFRKQKWYNPRFENVDKFLTETDKKNIDFILKLKAKLKDNEKSTVNKRLEQHVAAG